MPAYIIEALAYILTLLTIRIYSNRKWNQFCYAGTLYLSEQIATTFFKTKKMFQSPMIILSFGLAARQNTLKGKQLKKNHKTDVFT